MPPGLPAPICRSCRRRGGHCAARPSYHSDGARDRENRITWRCATKRPVSGLLRAASPTIFLGAGEVNGRAEVEGLETCREISGLPGPRSTRFGFGVDECFITPIKNLPSRWERMRKLEGGGQGRGGVQEPEGGREAASPTTYPNELIRTYKD